MPSTSARDADERAEPEDELEGRPTSSPSGPEGENKNSDDRKPQREEREKQDASSRGPAQRKNRRSGSVVSFKERCELYEVDLEAAKSRHRTRGSSSGADSQPSGGAKPPALKSLRYYIMVVALISPFIVTYSRTIINFAIIDMIHPDFVGRRTSTSSSSPAKLAQTSGQVGNETIQVALPYFETDNSCPVSEEIKARLLTDLSEDKRRASETVGEKFEWDTDKQGYLKAAYSLGHMLLQVMGGRLSEIYGSQLIMSASASLIGLACLSAPLLASIHFYLLFADLFFLGILGSFMTPSLITLFTNWLTPSEKSMTMSFYLVSSRLGYALSSVLCGLLIDAQLSWRYLFYSAGWVALAFAILFFFVSRNRPQDHPLIRQAELDYLASKNTLVREALAAESSASGRSIELKGVDQQDGKQQLEKAADPTKATPPGQPRGKSAPWALILTNLPVWAFIITKFCVKLAGDTVQTELPAYLQRVMHIEPRYNGYINSANYVIFCVSCLAVGMLAKTANKKHPFGWSKTAIRKLFQCTASFGVSLVLLGVSLNVCNETTTLVLFMAMFFVTTFSTGGEAQLPLDLSERYAGTIHAIGSSLAVSGAVEPIIVGYFLRGHASDRYRWENIWLAASGVAFLGGVVFLVFGKAEIQPFDNEASPEEKKPERVVVEEPTKPAESKVGHENKTFVPDEDAEAPRESVQI